ncbi:ATP synthase subunit O, mitochondrial [Dendrobium catenatum]|uniref:ATP synthase subunit O, mitochondrial n=1 Tax=Dendrobium catenatum TaxID=906689 RepID=A0A2I0XG83_9ASPA|nr:ATP synthase subunit O, mitochondrial [Dendrobium catenatum]PKU86926.1 ATP synthase subunit O, mitochondrial [Dendrobium catenatum]
MALSGRLRSGFPLFRSLLRTGAALSQRSIADPSFASPKLAASEHLRCFATKANESEASIKLPLSLFGGTGNYASALFLTAAKANLLDKVESEVLDVVEASKRSPLFSNFIKDLSIPRETRVKAVTEIFSEAGFTDVTKNFLVVLAENGRLKYLERIAQRFVDLTMAHRGEVKVIVTSVIPLPEQEEKELKQTLQNILGAGKTVKLQQKIDPRILGGLVIEFDQKVLDMSIKTRAKQMEEFLRQPIHFS